MNSYYFDSLAIRIWSKDLKTPYYPKNQTTWITGLAFIRCLFDLNRWAKWDQKRHLLLTLSCLDFNGQVKSRFQPVFWVRSTQTLVEICNTVQKKIRSILNRHPVIHEWRHANLGLYDPLTISVILLCPKPYALEYKVESTSMIVGLSLSLTGLLI